MNGFHFTILHGNIFFKKKGRKRLSSIGYCRLCCRASQRHITHGISTQIDSCGPLKEVASNVRVIGLWEEAAVAAENPRRHRQNMQTSHGRAPGWEPNPAVGEQRRPVITASGAVTGRADAVSEVIVAAGVDLQAHIQSLQVRAGPYR